MTNDYNPLAWFYEKYWGGEYHGLVVPVMETVFFPMIKKGARVLDLCCGAGHLSGLLVERGYRLTGVDSSVEMLDYARKRIPGGEFIESDVTELNLQEGSFDAVISTFESLNHMLTPEALKDVFANVSVALKDGGIFLFDMLTEDAYLLNWSKSSCIVEDDSVLIIRGGYDRDKKTGHTSITAFRLKDAWERSDVELFQRYHPPADIKAALKEAGFGKVSVYSARDDFKMPGDLGWGRVFFLAIKCG